ncbi:MAG: hypothetical protein LBU69_01215 [Deltaproteobacteria bacterium]|nr:hypothetical protein [Deltaproteobacteria bacterium]
MAFLNYETESPSGDGYHDIEILASEGTYFVFDLKYASWQNPDAKKDRRADKLIMAVGKAGKDALAEFESNKTSLYLRE